MRNLKKILALSLVFALVFSFGYSALAVNAKDFTDSDKLNPLYENSTDLLIALDVLHGRAVAGSAKTDLAPKENYLRQEMVYLTANILLGGKIEIANAYSSAEARASMGIAKYNDVWDGDWYAGALYYLTYMNVVSGDPNGNFRPKEIAKRTEAAKFALGIVGYDDKTEKFANDPAWAYNVISAASSLGLYANIQTNEDSITREEVFQMLGTALRSDAIQYNGTLRQKIQVTSANSSEVKYLTALEARFPMYEKIEGTLLANQYASVDDGLSLEKGRVYIGNKILDNVGDMSKAPVEMLGREVMAYAVKGTYANRYSGLLSTVLPQDEKVSISLGGNTGDEDYKKDWQKANGTGVDATEFRFNVDTEDNSATALGNAHANWQALFADSYNAATGSVTEAYALRSIGDKYYSYVMRNVWTFAVVTEVKDGKVTAVEFGDEDETVIDEQKADSFEGGADLKVDDFIMVLRSSDGKDYTDMGDTIAVQPIEKVKAVLSTLKGTEITISGSTYKTIGSNLLGIEAGEIDEQLAMSIADTDNFGKTLEYYIWDGKIVGWEGEASEDDKYCLMVDYDYYKGSALGGNKPYGKFVTDSGDVFEARIIELDDDDDAGNINTAIVTPTNDLYTGSNNTDIVLFTYSYNEEKSEVKLWIEDTDVMTEIGSGTTDVVKEGRSYLNYNDGSAKRARLNGDSLVFVKSGDDYFCFKGYDAPTPANTYTSAANIDVFAYGLDDGTVTDVARFAYLEYTVSTDSDKYAIINGNIKYDSSGKLDVMSFDMTPLDGTRKGNYTVIAGKRDDDEDIKAKQADSTYKGKLIKYTLSDDGTIKWFKLVGIADKKSSAVNVENWVETYIGYAGGDNFYQVNSAGAKQTVTIWTNNDTICADRTDDGNAKVISRKNSLLTDAKNGTKWLKAWVKTADEDGTDYRAAYIVVLDELETEAAAPADNGTFDGAALASYAETMDIDRPAQTGLSLDVAVAGNKVTMTLTGNNVTAASNSDTVTYNGSTEAINSLYSSDDYTDMVSYVVWDLNDLLTGAGFDYSDSTVYWTATRNGGPKYDTGSYTKTSSSDLDGGDTTMVTLAYENVTTTIRIYSDSARTNLLLTVVIDGSNLTAV